MITVKKGAEDVEIHGEKGKANDFSSNIERDRIATPSGTIPSLPSKPPAVEEQNPVVASPFIINESPMQGVVEVNAKIPHTATKVTLTIEVEPSKKN